MKSNFKIMHNKLNKEEDQILIELKANGSCHSGQPVHDTGQSRQPSILSS